MLSVVRCPPSKAIAPTMYIIHPWVKLTISRLAWIIRRTRKKKVQNFVRWAGLASSLVLSQRQRILGWFFLRSITPNYFWPLKQRRCYHRQAEVHPHYPESAMGLARPFFQ